jgi:streptomycin 6-kinase
VAGAGLINLADELAAEWGLKLGEPYTPGAEGHTLRVELRDGTPAVLKIAVPHRENEHEADALELWDGEGAVRLLGRDDERHAILIERCEPGTYLSSLPLDGALDVLIGLLPRLWKRAGNPFHTLQDEAEWWIEYLPRESVLDKHVLDAAVAWLRELAPTQGEQVLLHQDLHGENVLAARREPWLVIDPKPLLGEREFAVAPIVRSFEFGHSRHDALRRLDRLTSELGLDRERARGWTIGQTVAWATGSKYRETHLGTVKWLLR